MADLEQLHSSSAFGVELLNSERASFLHVSSRSGVNLLGGQHAGGRRHLPGLPFPLSLCQQSVSLGLARPVGRGVLFGQPGTKNGPTGRTWAVSQARSPVRQGPGGTMCRAGLTPHRVVLGMGTCRAELGRSVGHLYFPRPPRLLRRSPPCMTPQQLE